MYTSEMSSDRTSTADPWSSTASPAASALASAIASAIVGVAVIGDGDAGSRHLRGHVGGLEGELLLSVSRRPRLGRRRSRRRAQP